MTQCVIQANDPALRGIVGGRSRLGWLLREFTRYGVADFVLVGAPSLPEDLEKSLPHPVQIKAVPAPNEIGLASTLIQTRVPLQDRFLVCDGRVLLDWNLAHLLADAAADPPAVIGRVARSANGAFLGLGVFRHGMADWLRGSIADGVAGLAAAGSLRTTLVDGPWAEGDSQVAGLRRRALFLDRDGVLNIDHGYVGSRERFEWVDGALDGVRYATDAGWHVFIVTNQSGVARGLYTEDAVRGLLRWMGDEVRASGGTIDDVRFCPFHPEAAVEAYRRAHSWRKPLPGMLLDLIQGWELDPARAVLVGDQATDMQAAAAAGVAGYLFSGGNLLTFLRPILDRSASAVGPSPTEPGGGA